MTIKKIKIENFRSIKSLEFTPGKYCILIGENNAGKSNILKAISIILGETWPSERSFSEEDFCNLNIANDIVIQVYFDEEIDHNVNGLDVKIKGMELRCKAYKRRVGTKPAGTLKVNFVCLDENGKIIKYPPKPLSKGQKPEGYWPDLRVSNEIREQIPLIYIDVLREYEKHSPSSRWSIIRKLFNDVNTEFLNDKSEVTLTESNGNKVKLKRKEAFKRKIEEAYSYLRTDSFKALEEKLTANVLEQVGIDPQNGDVKLNFEIQDPSNSFKNLQLYINQFGFCNSASDVGAGLQSAIVIGIFRTYEEVKKGGAIFAIEEPEVFLHPHKARYFESTLEKISETGNQVFISTHSPIFVLLYKPESINIVRRNLNDGTYIVQSKNLNLEYDKRKELRLMTEFDTQRNELFFSNKVILAEGMTEKISIPLIYKILGVDINKLGISIVECGGKTKIPLFVKVVKAFNLPYLVIADEDIKEVKGSEDEVKKIKDYNNKHVKWNRELLNECDINCLHWLRPNFEGVFNLSSKENEKISQALEKFTLIERREIPSEIVETLLNFIKSDNGL